MTEMNSFQKLQQSAWLTRCVCSMVGGQTPGLKDSWPKIQAGLRPKFQALMSKWGVPLANLGGLGTLRARSQPGHCSTPFLQNPLPQCGTWGKSSSGPLSTCGVPDTSTMMSLHTSQQPMRKVLPALFWT